MAVRGKGHLPGVRTHPSALPFRVLPHCSQLRVSPEHGTVWRSEEGSVGHAVSGEIGEKATR